MSFNIEEQDFKWSGSLEKRPGTEAIVLHHAAIAQAAVQEIHSFHLSVGWAGIGYHFYVRKDGSIFRGRPEDTVGAHAIGHNFDSIGICFEGNFEEEKMSEPQFEAGAELINYLKAKYRIDKIMKHGDINSTLCPGSNFPFDEYRKVGQEEEEEDKMVRYKKLSDIPDNAEFRDIIEKLMTAGIVKGDGSDPDGNDDVIDLSHDQVRSLVFIYRGGGFDRKLTKEGLEPAVK